MRLCKIYILYFPQRCNWRAQPQGGNRFTKKVERRQNGVIVESQGEMTKEEISTAGVIAAQHGVGSCDAQFAWGVNKLTEACGNDEAKRGVLGRFGACFTAVANSALFVSRGGVGDPNLSYHNASDRIKLMPSLAGRRSQIYILYFS